MRITCYTDYALRLLMYLGLKGEKFSTISEVAGHYGISKNHLMKVVYELNLKGYIETTRGKHGGIHLHRAPEDINIGALVRATEQDMTLAECFGAQNQCIITPACALKSILAEALEAFFRVLDNYTLADLLQSREELARLLAIEESV